MQGKEMPEPEKRKKRIVHKPLTGEGQRRLHILMSPLGGLQTIASHLNELPGLRTELAYPECPPHITDEIEAWALAESIVSGSPAEGMERFNVEAAQHPVRLSIEMAPVNVEGTEEPRPFLAPLNRASDTRGKVLRDLWWYYFRGQGWERLKRCQVCGTWFVDTTKNKSMVRCSARCTTKWWTRDQRKAHGHKLQKTGGKQHGKSKR
jgi:hypothetical protein